MAKILIADDSAFMRSVLKNILAKGAYNDVIEASDGEDALNKIREEKPDLMLLDIIMPNLDGIGVLRELMPGQVKVIVISAVGQEKMMKEAKSLGATEFIVKPFDAGNVIESIRKVLAG